MKTALLALFILYFCPYLARADTEVLAVSKVEPFPTNCSVPAPDVSGWKVTRTSRIEFRFSDYAAAYLGLDIEYTEYRNPLNTREFVRVVSRHIPLIPEQKKIDDRIIFDAATVLYTKKEEQGRLIKLGKETDLVFFIRWEIKESPHAEQDQLDDDAGVNVWFHKSDGGCLVAKNEKVRTQFLTENIGDGRPRNVFVGVKYQVGDVYHILKVDRRDVLLLTNGRER